MASTTEKSHANNVANLETLISNVTSYGAIYNPSKASLMTPALTALLTENQSKTAVLNNAESAFKLAKDQRDTALKGLNPLVTKIINALKATETTDQIDEAARTLVRKIQGRRATPKKTEEQKKAAAASGNTTVEISTSQMGFDNRIDNFGKLIALLATIPVYAPNETELQVATLTALLNDLKAKTAAAVTAEVAVSNARIARNESMYKANAGLFDIAADVKTYIKSIFGATSPQYKQISKLKFTKPR
jgi:hypothetical protein